MQNHNRLVRVFGLLLLLITTQLLVAQTRADHWYFGQKAGLIFTANGVQVNTEGQMQTHEGSASISTPCGDLLFYTNGETVWDRRHQIMQNGSGLLGHNSSTQSAIIVPHPGNDNLYFLFTTDQLGGDNGLRYNLIDMTLNNGNGAIVQNYKNVLLRTPVAEKLTAWIGPKTGSTWVVAHGADNDEFLAYSITTNGLNTTPVVSKVGSVHKKGTGCMGQMKLSPSGKRLACAAADNQNFLEIFSFDVETGIVSNPDRVSQSSPIYGVEFSRLNEDFLLVTQDRNVRKIKIPDGNYLSDEWAMARSMGSSYGLFGLQNAPDYRIYIGHSSSNQFTGYVTDTKDKSIQFWFQQDRINLSRNTSMNLPNFPVNIFNRPEILIEGACFGSNTQFSVANQNADSIRWEIKGENFYYATTNGTAQIKFSKKGNYEAIAKAFYAGCNFELRSSFTIDNSPVVRFGPDTTLCAGSKILLWSGISGAQHWWSNQSMDTAIMIEQPGDYGVLVNYNGCETSANITVHADNSKTGFDVITGKLCAESNRVKVTDLSSGAPAYWSLTKDGSPVNLSDKNSSEFYLPENLNAGNYILKQTINKGLTCEKAVSQSFKVLPRPEFEITSDKDSACLGQWVFKIKRKITNGAAIQNDEFFALSDFEGKLDHATGDYLIIPRTHGLHTLQVKLTDTNGCSNSNSIVVKALELPDLGETHVQIDGACAGKTEVSGFVNFGGGVKVTKAEWFLNEKSLTFGDRLMATIIEESGPHNLYIELTGENGCKSTNVLKNFDVKPNPVASFEIDSPMLCYGNRMIVFKNKSRISDEENLKANWNFGNGQFANSWDAEQRFHKPGEYEVKLTVTSENGCETSTTAKIPAYPSPIANLEITAERQCENDNLFIIRNVSQQGFWPLQNYEITSDAGRVYIDDKITFSHDKAGVYQIYFKAEDTYGCADSIRRQIEIFSAPQVSFLINDPEQCLENNRFVFINKSQIVNGEQYVWKFADGTSHTGIVPGPRNFKLSGRQLISLKAMNKYGCQNEIFKEIIIFEHPVINILPSKICEGESFVPKADAEIKDGIISQWQWKLNGELMDAGPAPIKLMQTAGVYDLELIATSNNGCSSHAKLVKGVLVNQRPDAGFNWQISEWNPNYTARLTFTANVQNTRNLYEWSLDGASYTGPQLTAVSLPEGQYRAILKVTNQEQCNSETLKNITVKIPLDFYIPNAFTPGKEGKNPIFSPTMSPNYRSYSLEIFNRWGERLFNSNKHDIGWDGHYKGELQNAGNYSYVVIIEDNEGKTYKFSGIVTLIR